MDSPIERAREIARLLNTGEIDANLEIEIADLLAALAAALEGREQLLSSAQYALKYYGDAERYHYPGLGEVLDGGLRARTALRLLKGDNSFPNPELP
jgi:hypothetical protein